MASKEGGMAEPPDIISAVLDGTLIIVEVGPEHTEYHLYKAVLIQHSAYFRSAVTGPWTEGEDRRIVLEDIEPGTFNVFVHWLYTHEIPQTASGWSEITKSNTFRHEPCQEFYLEMLKALVFADRFLVDDLRRVVQNSFVDVFHKCPRCYLPSGYALIIYAFENLPSANAVLQYLVDVHCQEWHDEADGEKERELRSQLPNDFLVRVMVRYNKNQSWHALHRVSHKLEPGSYHEHVSELEENRCSNCYNGMLRKLFGVE